LTPPPYPGGVVTRPSIRRSTRSFLLRVSLDARERRYLVQDLRTGERREFSESGALERFLAELRSMRLR
jgi:hypothetical protein